MRDHHPVDIPNAAARIAESGEGVSLEELQLAARNHGMPLEALRCDVTPIGLHYLLVHYDIPATDTGSWELTIGGRVDRPARVTFEELAALPKRTLPVTIECAGNGRAWLTPRPVSQPWLTEAVGTAEWTGTPLAPLLARCGARRDAADVVFTGADHGIERGVEQDYARALSLADASHPDVLLAYEMNGQPLPPQHGAPVRLVVPGWYGMAHVKWLRSIEVLDHEFTGFQNDHAYRFKSDADERGEPVTRMRPRALLIPPGFPDFMSRTRVVDMGVHELVGRAWSGSGPVTRVQVSADCGLTWADAVLDPLASPWEWQRWRFSWRAEIAGAAELWCRATDVTGAIQPLEQPWNRQGMGNNMIQKVPVIVRSR